LSQVRSWDTLIFNELRKKHIVIPQKIHVEKDTQFAGAFVREPLPGLHRWISCFDVASLYPNLIRMLNISFETLTEHYTTILDDGLLKKEINTEYLKEKNLTLAANGHHFRKDVEGLLPQIMEKMFRERQEYKEKKIKAEKELEIVKKELRRRKVV
jgi:DNA polymerase elongation subunit (family B)